MLVSKSSWHLAEIYQAKSEIEPAEKEKEKKWK
jgi:hypothetical protein